MIADQREPRFQSQRRFLNDVEGDKGDGGRCRPPGRNDPRGRDWSVGIDAKCKKYGIVPQVQPVRNATYSDEEPVAQHRRDQRMRITHVGDDYACAQSSRSARTMVHVVHWVAGSQKQNDEAQQRAGCQPLGDEPWNSPTREQVPGGKKRENAANEEWVRMSVRSL